jgi:hypothetical protein
MNVEDEQIYRLRDFAPSERVRILAIHPGKQRHRYDVEFLDGEKAGRQENISGNRMRGPWSDVREYDERMANWKRLSAYQLTDHEESAAETVFQLLIPVEVAEWEWQPVQWVTSIHDPVGLERIIGLPVADLLAQTEWFELDGDQLVSPEGTLMIVEYACRTTPMPVLDWVVESEKEYRLRAKHGRRTVSHDKKPYTTSPEWEYQLYLERGRPLHELLRSWCGQRAATMQERLAAAEAEVQRLDQLVVRLIDELKQHGHSMAAEIIARTYEEERITPANYRPVIERPLKPSEIPTRYGRAPRRWGH